MKSRPIKASANLDKLDSCELKTSHELKFASQPESLDRESVELEKGLEGIETLASPTEPVADPAAQFDPSVRFDSGYSWTILFFGTVICAFSWGAASAYGVFLANYLKTNRYPGAGSMDFAFIAGLQYGVGLMLSPLPVYLLQHLPTFSSSRVQPSGFSVSSILSLNSPYKLVIMVGAIAQAGGYIGSSFAKETWQLYLSQGILVAIGNCFVFVTANALIPQWFLKKRGMANGVFTGGAGLGAIIFSLSVQALIDSVSLPWAQRYVGIFCGGMCFVSAFFMFERKQLFRRQVKIVNLRLLVRGDVWLAIVWGTIAMFCCGIVGTVLSSYGVSIGLDHHQSSILTCVLSVGIIVGRPLLGYLADLIGSINAAFVSTIFFTIFILAWWIPKNNYGSLIALSLFMGSVVGSFSVGFPPICASIVELEDFDTMISMSWGIIGAITIFSTPSAIGLTMIDGSYLYSQIFTGALTFISALVLLCSRVFVLRQKNGRTGPFWKLYFAIEKV